MDVVFNKPHYPLGSLLAGYKAAAAGTIAGNGKYTKKCQRFFEKKYGFKKALLTTSCTDALEMAAILARIEPGDEVIMPSFTFVSTANAFLLRGAKIVFADTESSVPNIDARQIESLINARTRAIVVVHYSGVACNMEEIMALASVHQLIVIEDAAHAIDSFYKDKPLGSIGDFGAFSFHETKNIFCGEGGMITINDEKSQGRSEIIWEKGTNRTAFYRGEIDKYGWVDIGSSYLPSDMLAAFLDLQLKNLEKIQQRRISNWSNYFDLLRPLQSQGLLTLPVIPDYATVNGNLFYFMANSRQERDQILKYLHEQGVQAVFHYIPLHSSECYRERHDGRDLPNTEKFSGCIVRLPFYYGLKKSQINYVVEKVNDFFKK
jgi:dTDP-4-amino-4,6-dideoxygalactose transaminase